MLAAIFALALSTTPICHRLEIRSADADGRAVEPSAPIATQAEVTRARVSLTEGQIVLNLDLAKAAGERLRRYTASHVGSRLAFSFDGKVLMAPRILDPIKADGFLAGPFDKPHADAYAEQINSGAAECLRRR